MRTLPVEQDGKTIGWAILCPGCRTLHVFYVAAPGRPIWQFNGNQEKPTFRNSMLVRCNPKDHPNHNPKAMSSVCHSFVTDGAIKFLEDSTHSLKGQTVDLPELDPATGWEKEKK